MSGMSYGALAKTCPTQLTREDVVFKDDRYQIENCARLYPAPADPGRTGGAL